MSMPTRFDWIAIRAMFEAGQGPSSIARNEGYPSKQAISKRAIDEGWTVIDKPAPALAVIPFDGLTKEQCFVVTQIANGATQRLAAQMAGYHETTVSEWTKDPTFKRALMSAKAAKVNRRLLKIDSSEDWRAAGWLLERDVDSREDFIPPNASRGMTGTTFNVLGHVHLGFERLEGSERDSDIGIPAVRNNVVAADAGRVGEEP